VTKNQGVIRKPDGTAFNAGRDRLEDSRNAEMMKSIRINMLNGEWSEECGRCKSEEDNGLNSRRIYESQQWKLTVDDARAKTAEDGSIKSEDFPLVYYDLRFGNFCNLKCRMCGPTDSSAWYEEWIQLTGSNKFKDTSGILEIKETKKGLEVEVFNWPEYEPFWEQLESNIHNIEHVYFAGGEPMLIERHYDFLERCVNKGFAKNITIEYNTNMTTLPSRVINLWKSFKQVRIGASVDGMGDIVEYQRYPVKWEKILKNLQTLDSLPSNIISWLAFTVTAYNVNHMIDFMKWKLSSSNFKRINSTKRRPIITHHVAHHPKHLNVRVLPDAYKKQVTLRFEEFLDWIDQNSFEDHVKTHAKEIVNGVVSYMNSDSYYSSEWNNFLKYTQDLDNIRNQNLTNIEPKFKEFYATNI
jgi:sulfatase maturation enzyme AslB (radical SAM superfamily)